jgi:hypothetical protein
MPQLFTHVSPFQVTEATAISKFKLINLINAGVIKAKRVDKNTVLVDWASVQNYIDSLPDVALQEVETQK